MFVYMLQCERVRHSACVGLLFYCVACICFILCCLWRNNKE